MLTADDHGDFYERVEAEYALIGTEYDWEHDLFGDVIVADEDEYPYDYDEGEWPYDQG